MTNVSIHASIAVVIEWMGLLKKELSAKQNVISAAEYNEKNVNSTLKLQCSRSGGRVSLFRYTNMAVITTNEMKFQQNISKNQVNHIIPDFSPITRINSFIPVTLSSMTLLIIIGQSKVKLSTVITGKKYMITFFNSESLMCGG
uniref:Uncharacterized protein n=1 Tax=Photinus pyralis TaxID=7054 RepID=A0A1Y1MHZ6_PHOPY